MIKRSFVPRAEGLISIKRAKLKTHKKCSVVFNECEKFQHQDDNQDFFSAPLLSDAGTDDVLLAPLGFI